MWAFQLTNLRHCISTPGISIPSQNINLVPHINLKQVATIVSLSSLLVWSHPLASEASIPLTAPDDAVQQRRQALVQLGAPVRRNPNAQNQPLGDPVKVQVKDIMRLMSTAEQAEIQGDYETALQEYTDIVKKYPELALAERARVPRALLLYQTGKTEEALLLLEDEEVALRGSPEVHAALAVVLHAERPNQVTRAEEQWERATEFDRRYEDVEWVAKRWPPKMVNALQRFLTLQ